MSRLGYIAAHPKQALGVMATVLAAAGLTAGSGAFFQDTSTSAGNSVKSGVVDIAVFGAEEPSIDYNNCRAGMPAAATEPCSSGQVRDNASAEGRATFKLKNLRPSADGTTPSASRSFTVKNVESVPVNIDLDVILGGDADLAKAITANVRRSATYTGVNGASLGNSGQNAGYFGSLWNADVKNDGSNVLTPLNQAGTTRVALEPGDEITYNVAFRMADTNPGSDQTALSGKAVTADLKVIATSIG